MAIRAHVLALTFGLTFGLALGPSGAAFAAEPLSGPGYGPRPSGGFILRGNDRFIAGEAPAAQALPGGLVSLNLVEAPLPNAAKAVLADTLGLGYTLDPQATGTVTLQTGGAVAREALLQMFEAALASRGLVLRRRGRPHSRYPPSERPQCRPDRPRRHRPERRARGARPDRGSRRRRRAPTLGLGCRDAGDPDVGRPPRRGAASRPGAQSPDPQRRRDPDPRPAPDHRDVRRRLDARHVHGNAAGAQRQPRHARPRHDADVRGRGRRHRGRDPLHPQRGAERHPRGELARRLSRPRPRDAGADGGARGRAGAPALRLPHPESLGPGTRGGAPGCGRGGNRRPRERVVGLRRRAGRLRRRLRAGRGRSARRTRSRIWRRRRLGIWQLQRLGRAVRPRCTLRRWLRN